MEHELETNNIKEKFINWKDKTFSLNDKYTEYKDKIDELNQLPNIFDILLTLYPLILLNIEMWLLPNIVTFFHKVINPDITTGILVFVIGFPLLFYTISEFITKKTYKKFKKWYLKHTHSEEKQIPLKNNIIVIEKEIENLLSNEEIIRLLNDNKPNLNEKESHVFYESFTSFKTWAEYKNYPEACQSLQQMLHYLIENDYLFEDKNKLIKHL